MPILCLIFFCRASSRKENLWFQHTPARSLDCGKDSQRDKKKSLCCTLDHKMRLCRRFLRATDKSKSIDKGNNFFYDGLCANFNENFPDGSLTHTQIILMMQRNESVSFSHTHTKELFWNLNSALEEQWKIVLFIVLGKIVFFFEPLNSFTTAILRKVNYI